MSFRRPFWDIRTLWLPFRPFFPDIPNNSRSMFAPASDQRQERHRSAPRILECCSDSTPLLGISEISSAAVGAIPVQRPIDFDDTIEISGKHKRNQTLSQLQTNMFVYD